MASWVRLEAVDSSLIEMSLEEHVMEIRHNPRFLEVKSGFTDLEKVRWIPI